MSETVIPYGRHYIDDDDVASVIDVLQHGLITQGPKVPEFEAALCAYTGANYCTLTTNATAALHLALLTLDIGEGDIVWTSPISFVASANCARYCGATIDFVDIDPVTRNLCPTRLGEKLAEAKKNNALPKAIIPVHLSGLPCDLEAIATQCKDYNIAIIEDASHAIGATYQQQPIGNGCWSDMTVFSFHPVKMITTGEGGAVCTNNPDHKKTLDTLRTHGITKNAECLQNSDQPDFYYEQQTLGFNYRMTDLQAALGLSQLKKLDTFIAQRQSLVSQYYAQLKNIPLICPPTLADRDSAWHIFITNIRLFNDTEKDEMVRNTLYAYLKAHDILCNVHYLPIHLQPYYQNLGFKAGDFPIAEHYARTALTLPLYGTLPGEQVTLICAHIADFFDATFHRA